MRYKPEEIFTPQGLLSEVEKNPNLDFLMNVFNIPRVFSVSGFGGGWTVGQHSFATALVAFFWAKYNAYTQEKRDQLVAQAVIHDLHEAVTGDILPMFKSKQIKKQLQSIQLHIVSALGTKVDARLETDIKIIDLVAFLYEIKQVSPSILHPKKLELAKTIAQKQRIVLLKFCKTKKVSKEKIEGFLEELEL